MLKRNWFYIWFVPLLWLGFSIPSFFYSGDEHGGFVIGAIAGTWISFLYQFDTLTTSLIPALLTGSITLGVFAFIMDLLGVKKKLWSFLFVIFVIAALVIWVEPFDTIQQIRWKHRSVLAVIFPALNWGIYLAIVFSIILNISSRLWRAIFKKSHKTQQ